MSSNDIRNLMNKLDSLTEDEKDYINEIKMPNYLVKVDKQDKDKADFIARQEYQDRYTKDGAFTFILTNEERLSNLVYHFLMQDVSIQKITHVENGRVVRTISPEELVPR